MSIFNSPKRKHEKLFKLLVARENENENNDYHVIPVKLAVFKNLAVKSVGKNLEK